MSKASVCQTATDPSPAMVKYLQEQDAYQSFLVGGYLASRSNIGEAGSKTDSVGGDKAYTTSEYFPSLGSDTVQGLIECQKSRKSEREGRARCYQRKDKRLRQKQDAKGTERVWSFM